MSPDGRSTRGRELALLALSHLESYDTSHWSAALDIFWSTEAPATVEGVGAQATVAELSSDSSSRRFARKLLAAMADHREEVDSMIGATATGWSLSRMSRVDRNLLRIAATEFLTTQTPRGVVVSEAVRLAARYGSENSSRFVNGVADAMAERARSASEPGSGESP